jgi:cytochrome c peroxidase
MAGDAGAGMRAGVGKRAGTGAGTGAGPGAGTRVRAGAGEGARRRAAARLRALVLAGLAATGIGPAGSAADTRAGIDAGRPGASAPSRAAPAAPAFAPAPRLWGDRPSVAQLQALGRAIFADRGLSDDGRLACASCHDPAAAFGPNARTPSPFFDDDDPRRAGTRAIPSLRYAQFLQPFARHHVDDEDGHGADGGPTGGLTWDGRADSARAQARLPLFAPNEMANADDAGLARRLAAAPYAARFRAAFSAPGRDVFDEPSQAVDWAAYALEVYEQSPEFAPFDSKYDRVLAGRATLTPAERRGLALFEDPARGHCASCHPDRRSPAGAAPLFTDQGLVAIAAPRRPTLPPLREAASPADYPVASTATGTDADLGLCRCGRPGLPVDPDDCGRFRTPTLRNVALRPSFFHNGSITSLRDAVAFYATRDTDPGRWYSRNPDGSVHVYDDLPAALRASVDHEIPFAPRPDGRPRLDERDIDDLVAFLRTLTDADVERLAAAGL